MKYMTKEWYNAMQKTDMYICLEVSRKAETFSEVFSRIYASKK